MLHIGVVYDWDRSEDVETGFHAYGCCDGFPESLGGPEPPANSIWVTFRSCKRLEHGEGFYLTKQGKLRWLE